MTQRTASMNLDWHEGVNGLPSADLPDIPGYPCKGGRHWQVNFDNISSIDTYEFLGYGFYISLRGAHHGKTLEEYDFGFGPVATTDEVKQEVESLSPEEIAQAAEDAGLEPVDNVSASRKGKYMMRKATRRTASMDLDWVNPSEDVYQADLPAIPGYTEPDGNESFVTVTYDNDGGVEAVATIFPTQGGVVNLDCWDILSFIPEDETLEDVMQAFDDLDVYDFSYQLDKMGIEPIVNEDGEYVVASRHATRRVASLGLDWEETTSTFGDTLYQAVLPAIPGYPYSGDGNSTVTIGPDFTDSRDGMYSWWMDIEVGKNDNKRFTDYELTGMSGEPLDYQMGYLDGLSVEWIADKLAENGYPPEED